MLLPAGERRGQRRFVGDHTQDVDRDELDGHVSDPGVADGVDRTGRFVTKARVVKVDTGAQREGTAIVTHYVLDICGGTPSAVTRAGSPPVADKIIDYDPSLSATLGGIAIEPAKQRAILEALGFGVTEGSSWRIAVPSWRRDVDAAPDIVEEVTRITGFDAIESVPLPRTDGVAKPTATAEQLLDCARKIDDYEESLA